VKFGIAFANAGPFAAPEMLAHLALTAEEVGVESLWTVEHALVPVGYQSEYPYDPSGKMPGGEEAPIPDPMLPLAYVAAITKKIKLATGVMILPQRHPAYVAKEAATLDVLSNGRAILGIGVGWLKEEFDALGIPFETRNRRAKEAVEAMRSLWKAEPEPFEGEFFRWGRVQSNPKPIQSGGVPIVMGGHSDLAAKRAARYCNGFFPAVYDPARVRALIDILRAECARIGRDASEIEVSTVALSTEPDGIKRLADLGISRLMMAPPAFDREGVSEGLRRFGDTVLAKL